MDIGLTAFCWNLCLTFTTQKILYCISRMTVCIPGNYVAHWRYYEDYQLTSKFELIYLLCSNDIVEAYYLRVELIFIYFLQINEKKGSHRFKTWNLFEITFVLEQMNSNFILLVIICYLNMLVLYSNRSQGYLRVYNTCYCTVFEL